MSLKAPIKSKFRRWTSDSSAHKDGRKIKKNLHIGWFSIFHEFLEKPDRKNSRGKWFKITSEHGHCYRVMSMDPTLHKNKEENVDLINIDWDGWLALSSDDDTRADLVLTIEPVRVWDYWRLGWTHPDPAVRTAWVIALISLGLGILSLIV